MKTCSTVVLLFQKASAEFVHFVHICAFSHISLSEARSQEVKQQLRSLL